MRKQPERAHRVRGRAPQPSPGGVHSRRCLTPGLTSHQHTAWGACLAHPEPSDCGEGWRRERGLEKRRPPPTAGRCAPGENGIFFWGASLVALERSRQVLVVPPAPSCKRDKPGSAVRGVSSAPAPPLPRSRGGVELCHGWRRGVLRRRPGPPSPSAQYRGDPLVFRALSAPSLSLPSGSPPVAALRAPTVTSVRLEGSCL